MTRTRREETWALASHSHQDQQHLNTTAAGETCLLIDIIFSSVFCWCVSWTNNKSKLCFVTWDQQHYNILAPSLATFWQPWIFMFLHLWYNNIIIIIWVRDSEWQISFLNIISRVWDCKIRMRSAAPLSLQLSLIILQSVILLWSGTHWERETLTTSHSFIYLTTKWLWNWMQLQQGVDFYRVSQKTVSDLVFNWSR